MFRRRLQVALTFLAAAALLQGAVAWWAIEVASHHVQRGRVASDILGAFLELSANKQRLRTWVSQSMVTPQNDGTLRDRLLTDMASSLARIQSLARDSVNSERDSGDDRTESRQRQAAIDVLAATLGQIRVAVDRVQHLPAGTLPAQALRQLDAAFDVSQGLELRNVLAESIAREQVAMARERAAADRSLSLVRGLALGTTLALGLTAALLSLYFAQALRRPLEELRTGAEALQRGDLAHRIDYARPDEFGEVARTMNAMAQALTRHGEQEATARQSLEALVQERTQALQQALHTAQLQDARRRQLFADVSHELRTPTTAIRGEAEIALRGADKPADDYRLALRHIAESSRHLSAVIDDLLNLARHDMDALSLQKSLIPALQPIEEALTQLQGLADERGIRLRLQGDTPADARLHADGQRLRQLFLVLLDNALRYSPRGSEVQVEHGLVSDPDNPCDTAPVTQWEVCIRDQGVGIPPEELNRVFERGFRGRLARQHRPDGEGLGLSIAQGLARAHGGGLDIDSSQHGTEVRCVLPLHAPTGGKA